MHRTILFAATGLLVLCAAFTPAGFLMAQTSFPEPDMLPSHPELPDPLVMFNGERVASKKQWIDERRPELKALFQHYMYGHLPPPAKIKAKVEHEDAQAFGGKATLREVAISVGLPDAPPIRLLLVVPNQRKGPAPVFVGINFCGNHAIVNDREVRLPTSWMYSGPGVKNKRATEAGRGKQIDVWALEQSIDRGYAVATFYNGDIDPDERDVRAGIQPYLRKKNDKPGPHDWGTIAAWAWGVHRVVDYVHDCKDLDRNRIAVVGHSRLGKTALLAAALDERIALTIPHQAGCGGTAPSRTDNPKAESVKKINTSFPHWFDDTFKQFNDCTDKLPFDQHCLIALMAPRPVLLSNAVLDQWANPSGQFQMLQAADPVYRFLGAGGLAAKRMPPPDKLIDSPLGYYIRPGEHSMTKEDWKIFLDFADKHFGKPDPSAPSR
ncbi:MAG TPA: acetylxylan esterase [Gemmataceae bacterium]|nr:acetylxylan esterase [Gemmataceae bacterium]